jgi:KDO2-lipid IV(A) lauroyltransferase
MALIRRAAYQLAAAAAPRVPRRVGYLLFSLVADAALVASPSARRLVAANLQRVVGPGVPERQLRGLVRGAFRNLLWAYFELFRLPAASLDELQRDGTLEGIEHLDRALDGGRTGALLVFAHVGNLETSGQMALLYPRHRFVAVVGLMEDEWIQQFMRRQRMSQGLATVPTDEPIRLVKMLQAGWNVIIAGDLDSTGTGIEVDFFGHRARMPQGAVRLALLTGAPLLVISSRRVDPRRPERFLARVDPPLALAGSGWSPDDVRAGVETLVARLEEIITERPEQWLAFRPVWNEAPA